MINWWLWGAFAQLISKLDDSLSMACKRPPALLATHAEIGVLLPALYVSVAATLQYHLGVINWNPWGSPLGSQFDWYVWAFIVYCMILGTLKGGATAPMNSSWRVWTGACLKPGSTRCACESIRNCCSTRHTIFPRAWNRSPSRRAR